MPVVPGRVLLQDHVVHRLGRLLGRRAPLGQGVREVGGAVVSGLAGALLGFDQVVLEWRDRIVREVGLEARVEDILDRRLRPDRLEDVRVRIEREDD